MSSNVQSSCGYLNPSNSEQYKNFYKMKELDEVRGPFQHLEQIFGGLVAIISDIPVFLPSELEEELRDKVGQKIGLLRLDGYRVRTL